MKVIKKKNLPIRIPFTSTAVSLITMDIYNAPEWLWGAVILFWFIIWIVIVINIYTEKSVDIFKDVSDKEKPKSKFKERLNEELNK